MDIVPICKRVIGLDVHQAQITGCAIVELPDGSITYERREFGGFKCDRKALAEWARSIAPDVVVMESTGIYWKSPYAALEGSSSFRVERNVFIWPTPVRTDGRVGA